MKSRRATVSLPRLMAAAVVLTPLLIGAQFASGGRHNVARSEPAAVGQGLVNESQAAAVAGRVGAGGPPFGSFAVPAVSPGTFTGKGFDACSAPSSAAMNAW